METLKANPEGLEIPSQPSALRNQHLRSFGYHEEALELLLLPMAQACISDESAWPCPVSGLPSTIPEGPKIKTLRAKGTLISEPRFSTPCQMRFFPREKGKTAFVKEKPSTKAVFPFSRGKTLHPAGGRKSGLTN